MKFTCDRCDAQYMISDEKVGPNGVKVRCKKCSHIILVRRPAENGAAGAEVPVPAPAPAPGGSGEGLDAELGQAFDNAFGDGPAKAPAPGPDPDATQAVSPEEAAHVLARSAAPEPAATEWYVAIGQAQVGPLPLVEVRRKWEAGDIGPDSLVWRPGMGDWAALTGVSDLAAYLAPVARGAVRPQPQPAPAATRSAAAPAEARRIADVSWKPVGASALAALASEEIAGQPPEARPESKPVVSAKSLVDGLPDGGGVDPTGAIPLQIKALESTGEAPVARSTVARGAEKIRKRRSSTRALTMVVVLLLLALVGGGGYVGYDLYLKPRLAAVPAPAAPVAAAEKPAAPPAEVAQPAPAPKPAEPAAAGTASASAPPEPAAAAPSPAPAATEAAATPPPPPVVKEPDKPRPEPARPVRTARAEKKVREPPPRPERVAKAEPPPKPAPQPAKKKGSDLLDFDSNDAALNDALNPGGSSGRSVYVPPAPGGADALPQRVTDSQVNETIMTRVSALQGCLTDNKSEQSGVLKMRWAIAPDGSVQNLKCISPESANTPFAQCVTGVLKGLRFPKTAQGRPEVTFPFKF